MTWLAIPQNSDARWNITLPSDVEACYNEAYSALMDWQLSRWIVANYMSPEWIRTAYKNQWYANVSDKEVVDSAYRFARDVRRKIEATLLEQRSKEEKWEIINPVEKRYTRYIKQRTKRVIKGTIWKYSIEAILHPTECKFLKATIEWVKSTFDWLRKDERSN